MDLMHAVPFARTARVWAGPDRGLPRRRRHRHRRGRRAEARRDADRPRPEERRDLPRARAADRRGQPGRDHPRRDQPGRRARVPHLADQRPARRSASSAAARSSTPHASGCCSPSTTASTRARSTPGWRASTATPRCRSGARPTSRACRSTTSGSTTGHRPGRRGARADLHRHPRCRVPDHRAQGRHVLRRRGGPRPDRPGDPARPAHRALGELADPRLLRHRRRLPVAAGGHRAARGGADRAARAVRRGGVRAAEVGGDAARDDRRRSAWTPPSPMAR